MARSARPSAGRAASIIMACRGQLELTRLAVPRLLRLTATPFELHLIDLGSLDGTAEYLAGIAAAASVPVQVTSCRDEIEFPGLLDAAVSAASGGLVCFVSNETLVTAGWIEGLARALDAEPRFGIVGPAASYGTRDQLPRRDDPWFDPTSGGPATRYPDTVQGAPPELDAFAARWRRRNKGPHEKVEMLSEACLVMRSTTARQIAPWSSLTAIACGRRSLNHFVMSDVAARIANSGLSLGCARDVFIHNFGTRPAT